MNSLSLGFLAGLKADIHFGIGGNAAAYQLRGWSFPEKGFTWSLGLRSAFCLPPHETWEDEIIILEGEPFLQAARLDSQSVRIIYAGCEIAAFRVSSPFVRAVRLHQNGSDTSLALHYPESAAPAKFGSTDNRSLAIAWRRIRVVGVPRARRGSVVRSSAVWPNIAPSSSTTTSEALLAIPGAYRGASAVPRARRRGQSVDVGSAVNRQELERLVIEGLQAGDLQEASVRVAQVPGLLGLRIELDATLPADISVVRCTMNGEGDWAFGFSTRWRGGEPRDPASMMVTWHWLSILPLFAAYSQRGLIAGTFLLSLGDEAHGRGVSFCADNDDSLLIPDPYFMRSFGYEELKQSFKVDTIPFQKRRRAALWRGSTTGYRYSGDVFSLPRVRLCLRARETDAVGLIDAGLTGFVQLLPGEEEQLRSMDLERPFVTPERLREWMFHIDIDGNTNSWPGLFSKLLSGSVVLKVASEKGWRQWYYERLGRNAHLAPVSADLSDLVDMVRSLIHRADEAEELAREGEAFALSMSYEREVLLGTSTLEDAIVQEALLEMKNGDAQDGLR